MIGKQQLIQLKQTKVSAEELSALLHHPDPEKMRELTGLRERLERLNELLAETEQLIKQWSDHFFDWQKHLRQALSDAQRFHKIKLHRRDFEILQRIVLRQGSL